MIRFFQFFKCIEIFSYFNDAGDFFGYHISINVLRNITTKEIQSGVYPAPVKMIFHQCKEQRSNGLVFQNGLFCCRLSKSDTYIYFVSTVNSAKFITV